MKIVFAFDGSSEARDALKCLSWFKQDDLEVVLVSVAAKGPALDDKGDAVDADPAEVNAARQAVTDVALHLSGQGIPCEPRILVGDPPEEIIRLARAEQANLIITGRRGLSTVRRVMFGSVSSKILSDAPCPVLVGR
ncbi:MAG: universal stress protein [Thauera sp.]